MARELSKKVALFDGETIFMQYLRKQETYRDFHLRGEKGKSLYIFLDTYSSHYAYTISVSLIVRKQYLIYKGGNLLACDKDN